MADVAIIGAGAAGIAAAHTLAGSGLDVVVLEAKGRIGGRAHTVMLAPGVPFDRGCYWLHSASLNPFVGVAASLGFAVRRGRRHAAPRRIHRKGVWAGAAQARAWRRFEARTTTAIEAAGARGLDIPAARLVDASAAWAPLYAAWTTAISGVAPEGVSTLDHVRYRDTGENWPVRDGFGALVARWGADVPVRLRTPGGRIDWSGADVGIETPDGTVRARAVIVTASTSALAAGAIRFAPALPAWKLDAIESLPLGMADKVALAFRPNTLGVPDDTAAHALASDTEPIHFQLRPFGRDLAVGHVGGAFASALERAGKAAMIDFAVERVAAMFGSAIRRRIVAARATAWESDRWIRGGYSAAHPGAADRRADLAAPLGGRIFFAGEATSREFYSTAHGAYLSGVTAARRVMETLATNLTTS